MIVARGMPRPPSLHDDRLREESDQHFFDVITNGYGVMYSHASRVRPRDRWAIVAYIRALQASQHATLEDVPPTERERLAGAALMEWRSRALPALACAGLVGTAIALLLDPHDTLAAYLAAVIAASAVPIGALLVLMISYLVPGRWTNEMHVPLTAATLLIPVAGLMFVPVLAGLPWLYPWVGMRPMDTFKSAYLVPWFFVLRSVGYFIIWTAIALWARQAWGDKLQMTRAASAGLIIYALTVSLAGIDWVESLSPDFHSSIYGLLFLTFQLLGGLSFGIAMVVATRIGSAAPTGYGALLLSTLLLWAYMHAMQYIIIWAGNIPREVTWYLRRETGGWGFVLWGLIFLQFVCPFFALLLERVRNGSRPLLVIACGTLGLRFVESCLLVLPSAQASGSVLWLAIPASAAATIGLLGFSLQVTLAAMARSAPDTRSLPAAG